MAGHLALIQIDHNIRGTNHTGDTELAGNHCSVRGGTTFTCEDTFGCQHTVHIIRLGEWPHHDDILFFNIVHLFNRICIEIDPTYRSTRRSVNALSIIASF